MYASFFFVLLFLFDCTNVGVIGLWPRINGERETREADTSEISICDCWQYPLFDYGLNV